MKDLDWLLADGSRVQEGSAVIFAVTGKILYLETPVGGTIRFNERLKTSPTLIGEETNGDGWLFEIAPEEPAARAFEACMGQRGTRTQRD